MTSPQVKPLMVANGIAEPKIPGVPPVPAKVMPPPKSEDARRRDIPREITSISPDAPGIVVVIKFGVGVDIIRIADLARVHGHHIDWMHEVDEVLR
jgi:hypothetical protein